jgi:hypothetical protein
MMPDDEIKKDQHPDQNPDLPDQESPGEIPFFEKKGMRVKKRIKKRVRIKKKPGLKKRLKKILGYVAWTIVLAGFIITLVVMLRELEIKDEEVRKKGPKKRGSLLMPSPLATLVYRPTPNG